MAAILWTIFSIVFNEYCFNLDWSLTEFCYQWCNWKYVRIGSDNCIERNWIELNWVSRVLWQWGNFTNHYDDVIMTMLASQITILTVVYSIVYSGVNQRKHQSSASLAFVREIHPGPVNFPHKWPVTRKMFPFDDVIIGGLTQWWQHQWL